MSRSRSLLAAGLLLALGVAAHAGALDAPFLFDDGPAIVENPRIRSLWPPRYVLAPPRDTPVAGRPLVNASFALNHALGGLEPRGYHVFNLAVHLGCALLLFGLARRSLEGRVAHAGETAWAGAALWLVHPLTSECVAYATQRTESLMALFYLLTLYAVARRARAEPGRRWTALAIAACALGMLSKETMASAPVVALLYDRAYGAGSLAAALRRRRGLYAGLATCWLLLAASLVSAPRAGSVGASLGVTPGAWLANQAWVVPSYLRKVVWPHPLVLDYGWPRAVGWGQVAPELTLLVALAAGVLWLAWRRPALGFPLLAGLLVLAPTSTLLPIVTEVGAERRMYLPLAGICVLAATGLFALPARCGLGARGARAVAWLVLAGLLVTLTGVSRARYADYRSEEAIWRSVVAAVPDNPRGLVNLGAALRARGESREAEKLFRAALELRPGYARAEAQLGLLARSRGDLPAAERHLRRALEADPRHGDVRSNLGALLMQTGRVEEALAQWRRALEENPDLGFAANNLAWVLATHPDPRWRDGAEAVRLAERAAELSARVDAGVLDTLAAAYAEAGRWAEAERTAEQALAVCRDAELAAELRGRLAGYRARRPHRAAGTAPVSPGAPRS